MEVLIFIVVGVPTVFALCVILLCLGKSKECYQCGDRLENYNRNRYRINNNKAFCTESCLITNSGRDIK